jgi:tRNA(His) guanylyltransferase
MKKNKDQFGDRMKMYENATCGIKMLPLVPIIARLDGKSFSNFTRGLKRPYDERLSKLMIETTKYLVKETNANCGYTQSDEITLVWYVEDMRSQIYFGGRFFKMVSDLSAMASVFFNRNLEDYLPEKKDKMPRFDCRVYNVPNQIEAVNAFLWREKDATKNSVSMAASEYYSHSQLHKKHGGEMQEMLFQKGINWNDYPAFFKMGTYIQRKRVLRPFTTDELEKLPMKHKARQNPDLEIERWEIGPIDMPPLSKVTNRVDVIIFGKDPITK